MSHILLYSGGVDSTVCLNRLLEQGITPLIFHFKTKKLNNKHEKMIRRVARKLSPKSMFYTFETWTYNYVATWQPTLPYYFIRWRKSGKRKWFCPNTLADTTVLGYTRWLYCYNENHRFWKGDQRDFIDFCRQDKLPFFFPIADMKRPQIDQEFRELPISTRKNVVSSTRNYDLGCAFVKPSKW